MQPRLERVLRRGLSTRPDERYESMNELLGAVQAAVAPRRYGLALGVAATLVVGGVAAAAFLPSTEATSCGGRASMASTWSADEARKLQEAFEATGIPMAEANGRQAVRRLDGYAERWVDAHTAQCRERREADAETQVLLDRRIACLSERRSALSAVVEVLQNPDPTIVEHAASAVQELDDLATCTDDERLADTAQRKVDPQIAGRVEELAHELGRARALQSAGAEERGLKLLDGIEARVLTTDYPPLHADMWFIRGSLLGHRGDNAEGREFVARAFDIATAQGMDELAADSALRLIGIELSLGSKADVTRRWARHADAAIARLGRPPRLQVTYLEFLSFVLGHEGNRQEGDRLLREALELVEREMPDDSIAASNVHNALGRAAAHAGDHDAAIEHFQHAHRRLAVELGQSHPDVVRILSSIQDVYRAQGKFDRAHELDELLFPLLISAYGPEHPEVVSTLVRRGTLLAAEGFSEDALEYYTRGLEITEKRYGPEHPVGGTILSNRAIVLSSMGRHEAAVADQRRVLRIAEASFPPHHPRVGVALDNLGSALVGAGQAAEAIPLHRRSLPIWSRHGENSPSLAISLTDHGLALLEHGVPADAVPLLERAVRIFESRTLDPAELARARFVLARALVASGADEARAQTMAAASREIYVEAGPGRREDVEAIDRWTQTLHAPADP